MRLGARLHDIQRVQQRVAYAQAEAVLEMVDCPVYSFLPSSFFGIPSTARSSESRLF